ncbi:MULTISPECIES: hypothetical protein [Corallococcus]|uniref:Uncharacterized protein n=2 Tax=Corallococcus TaxID=83461 RepID=A0A3A8QAC9_9BACT|nr:MULTISPECIES: hypothetical protein [Corallococcus]MBN8232781.1 hypothetical protein [Corallococcus macrosporus]RKH64531.1 hypothetical protein D7W81_18445 [Corallococcus aberystwythensis]
MLDAFIIEEIKRRERLRREDYERPVVELPLPAPDDRPQRRTDTEEEKPSRGVVVIDLLG